MPTYDAWRVLTRPRGYREIPGNSAPTTLESASWSVKTTQTTYTPKITLTDDTEFVFTNPTRSTTEDERIISKEFHISNFDFTFRIDFSKDTSTSQIVLASLCKNSRKFFDATYPVISDMPHQIWLHFVSDGANNMTVALKAADGDTVLTSAGTLSMIAGFNPLVLTRIGNTLTLRGWTDNQFATELSGSPQTLDISSLALDELRFIQIGNYPDGGAAGSGVAKFKNVFLEMASFFNYGDEDRTNIRDISLELSESDSKTLSVKIDDPTNALKSMDIGDEIIYFADNYSKNLIASYDMDYQDTDNKFIDYSGFDIPMTLQNGATVTGITRTGKVEQSIELDGVNDRALADRRLSSNIVLKTEPFSIGCWFNMDAHDAVNGETILNDNQDNWEIEILPSRLLKFSVEDGLGGGGSVTGTTTINDATWYHVILTWTGTNGVITGYLNGIQEAQSATLTGGPATFSAIGISDQNSPFNDFDGLVDEVVAWKIAIPSSDVRVIYERGGRCPKMYFRGIIDDISRDSNGIVNIDAIENLGDYVNQEVYDLIFEGHCLPSTKGGTSDKPALVFQTSDLRVSGSDNITRLVDVDGSSLNNETTHSIQDIVVGWNKGANIIDVSSNFMNLVNNTFGHSFMALSSRIDKSWHKVHFDLTQGTPTVTIQIVKNKSHATEDVDMPDTSRVIATKTIAGGTWDWSTQGLFQIDWTGISFSENLQAGPEPAKYWIYFSATGLSNYPSVPYFRVSSAGSEHHANRDIYQNISGTESWLNEYSPAMVVVFNDLLNSISKISEDDYMVEFDATDGWRVRISTELSRVATETVNDAFILYYIYSKSSLKQKHVIERLLRKTGRLTGSYKSGSRITTTNLGLYVPQGGTVQQHVKSIANSSSSVAVPRTPDKVFVEDAFRRSTLRNGTMEDKQGWTFSTNAASIFRDTGYSTAAPKTGSQHYRIDVLAAASVTGDNGAVYQDIDKWGGSVSVWWKTTVSNTNMAFKIFKEPFGGGTRTELYTTALTSTSYTRVRIASIADEKFRLVFAVQTTANHTPSALSVDIDDVFQTQFNGWAFYGFKDGFATEVGQAMDQETLSEINSLERSGEISKMTNIGIVFIQGRSAGGSGVKMAAAKDVRLYDKFGPRMAVRESGTSRNTTSSKERYNRAKDLINARFEENITIKVNGVLPFIWNKGFYILYPDAGISEWKLYNAQEVRVGLDTSIITAREVDILSSYAINKLDERQQEEVNTVDSPLTESFSYIVVSDCNFISSPGTIKDAAIIYSAESLISNKVQNPDTGVYIFEWGRRAKLAASPSADTYTKFLRIRNTSSTIVGEVGLSHGFRFVKLKNMRVYLVAFDRKVLLGQA